MVFDLGLVLKGSGWLHPATAYPALKPCPFTAIVRNGATQPRQPCRSQVLASPPVALFQTSHSSAYPSAHAAVTRPCENGCSTRTKAHDDAGQIKRGGETRYKLCESGSISAKIESRYDACAITVVAASRPWKAVMQRQQNNASWPAGSRRVIHFRPVFLNSGRFTGPLRRPIALAVGFAAVAPCAAYGAFQP